MRPGRRTLSPAGATPLAALAERLQQRRDDGLYRTRRVTGSAQGPELVVDGRRVLAFCANDYLGLAADPRVSGALSDATRRYGVGSGAAHLISGHSEAHHALERELADFVERDAALLFSTGYMANIGVLTALLGRGDHVFQDRLNHASLIDGGLQSRARLHRFAHADAGDLRRRLVDTSGVRLVATDGVFSMDGDVAPLAALADVCAGAGAWFMVDDAHGIGVVGDGGRGSVAAAGLGQRDVPILMGTLGKALGTAGAFVAGPTDLVEALIQFARPYVYTTAMPPALAEATRTSLRISQAEGWRRDRLQGLIARFRLGVARLGLPLLASDTPIQPILLGTSASVARWSDALWRQGVLVGAIRPPTVPADAARLRITLSAAHTPAQVDTLLAVLEETRDSLGDA